MIYKICGADAWAKAVDVGRYEGSADDGRDGFIHFSTEEQLRGTLDKHFAGQVDLVLIAVDGEMLGDMLKWEPSRGGALFPHLYAALDVSNARSVKALAIDDNSGRHIIPDGIP